MKGLAKPPLQWLRKAGDRDPRRTRAKQLRLGIMLHFWLIPVLAILVFIVALLYLAVRAKGGDGVRRDGRIVHDKPTEDDNPPPR
jgi:hypothetical protein